MNVLKLKLTGTAPLLMHSDLLANPINPKTRAHKALTDKRKKTEDDHLMIARSEFEKSLYTHNGKIVMPTINLRASFIDGAKLNRLGASFQRGTLILEEFVPLDYSGPKTADKLFDNPAFVDCRSVVISGRRLMRYRPRFSDWAITVDVLYDDSAIDREDVLRSAQNAGQFCGLGDFRPTKKGPFGRYKVEVIEEIEAAA